MKKNNCKFIYKLFFTVFLGLSFSFGGACGKKEETPAAAASNVNESSAAASPQQTQKSSVGAPPTMISVTLTPEQPNLTQEIKVTAQASDPENDPVTYSYQWFVNGQPLSGEVLSTLSPGKYVRNNKVFCEVKPSDRYFDGASMRSGEIIIVNSPPTISDILLLPEKPGRNSGLEGQFKVSDPDGDPVQMTYTWFENGKILMEATGEKIPGTLLKKATLVWMHVKASDGKLDGDKDSPKVPILNSPPQITSTPPKDFGTQGTYNYTVQATDPDKDPIKYAVTGPAGMAIDATSGALTWKPQSTQSGNHKVRIEAADNDGATGYQEYDLAVSFRLPK